MTTTTHNTLHKRYQDNLKQIRNIHQQNNLTITRADKSKSIVIINKSALKQKVDDFIQENHISCLNKDPTDTKANPKRNSKMQHTDRQARTEVPDKHKTNGSKT
jgi:hypothetical protein